MLPESHAANMQSESHTRDGRASRVLFLYYTGLGLVSLAGIAYGFFFSELFFPDSRPEWFRLLMTLLKLSWLIPLPYALINYYSFIRYPVYEKPAVPHSTAPLGFQLYFRIVTRGHNPKLAAETVRRARRVLEATLIAHEWRIEVVTDHPLAVAAPDGQVQVILVPSDYQSAVGTQYKARALHYALNASLADESDWIVHLDEETGFDEETVWAIRQFVAEEGRKPLAQRRIGQGIVLYGKTGVVNWLTTLADSLRVGDDYGRFRLQFEYGKAYFGMHGSFVVINNGVESSVGFDHGHVGSITEDAYLALLLQARGYQFKFIHAFMYERSPFSLADFVRQRRRWFGGLWLCALSPTLPLGDRVILGTFMLMWSTCWLSISMVYLNLLIPAGTPVWLGVIGGLSFSYYVLLYLIGYLATFYRQASREELIARFVQQILLIPFFSLMEAAGVLHGLISPPKDFYIVQKEVRPFLSDVVARPAGAALWLRVTARQVVAALQKGELLVQAVRWRIAPRDATGVYVAEFWLRALQWRMTRALGGPLHVVCLGFEVNGLDRLQEAHGASAVEKALAQIASALTRNFRAYDLICRYPGERFAVALLRCTAQFGEAAAERVASRLVRQTLHEINHLYGVALTLDWKAAPLPRRRVGAPELASTIERLFDPPALRMAAPPASA